MVLLVSFILPHAFGIKKVIPIAFADKAVLCLNSIPTLIFLIEVAGLIDYQLAFDCMILYFDCALPEVIFPELSSFEFNFGFFLLQRSGNLDLQVSFFLDFSSESDWQEESYYSCCSLFYLFYSDIFHYIFQEETHKEVHRYHLQVIVVENNHFLKYYTFAFWHLD